MAAAQQRQARAAAGTSRVLAKLNLSLEAGHYYEAHQMYRTLYFRYTGQMKFAEAEDLLYDGAKKLFKHNQLGSGSDLSKLYIEVLSKRQKRSDEELEKTFQRIAKLFNKVPRDGPDFEGFKGQSIRWSSSSEHAHGAPRLHQVLAYTLWSSKRYPESRQNFLHSCDGNGCGEMLVEFHKDRGFPREVDLIIVNTVLQYLVLRKHIVAAWALKVYTEKHPSIQTGPPYKHPLLNFVWLLLLAIEQKQTITAFSILVEKYKPSLTRDPAYLEYIDKIGQHFFGLPEPQRPRGMFSGIVDSLFSAMNEGEEDSPPNGRATTTATTTTTSGGASSTHNMEAQDLD